MKLNLTNQDVLKKLMELGSKKTSTFEKLVEDVIKRGLHSYEEEAKEAKRTKIDQLNIIDVEGCPMVEVPILVKADLYLDIRDMCREDRKLSKTPLQTEGTISLVANQGLETLLEGVKI